jgi:hypothetical protein
MRGVHANRIADIRTNGSGEFLFKDVPAGDYVLLATQGPKVLGLTTVRLPLSTSPVLIDVGEGTRMNIPIGRPVEY